MVSAVENSGIEAMWDTVQNYRTTMEVSVYSLNILSLLLKGIA